MSSITRRKKKPLLRLIKKFARSTYNWYQEEEWGTHGTEEYRQNTRHTWSSSAAAASDSPPPRRWVAYSVCFHRNIYVHLWFWKLVEVEDFAQAEEVGPHWVEPAEPTWLVMIFNRCWERAFCKVEVKRRAEQFGDRTCGLLWLCIARRYARTCTSGFMSIALGRGSRNLP